MSAEDRKFVLPDLKKGTDERWQTTSDSARRIRDMVWDPKGGWKTCGGFEIIYAVDQGVAWSTLGAVSSLHWYSEHAGARKHLIVQGNGKWYESDGTALTVVALTGKGGAAIPDHSTPDSPYLRAQSVAISGFLYILNGGDIPFVFNGRFLEEPGFAGPPPAPTTQHIENASYSSDSMGIGSGVSDYKWARRYRVSFVNQRGQESPLSVPSEVVEGVNGEDAKTSAGLGIPRGGSNVVARRIYATHNILDSEGELLLSGEAQNYYFLAEIQDNSQTSFEDAIPDAYISAVVDPENFGPWPMGAQFIAVFGGSVFLSGQDSSTVAFSDVGTTEVFPPGNILSVGGGSSGEFTGLHPTKNALVVFKRNAIYLIKGDPREGFYVVTLTENTGCIAPDSLAEIPNIGLAFLGPSGPCILEGALENTGNPTRIIPIWSPIPDMVERINIAAAIQAQGAVYHKDREYWLAVPWDAASQNNTVMIYHYDIGAWSFRESFPIASMVVTSDHRQQLFFGSNDAASHAGIYAYTHGASTKNGVAIGPLYETADIDFGDKYTSVVPETVTIWAVGYGDQPARIRYTSNRSYKQTFALGESYDDEKQQDSTNIYSVLGSVDWDASVWYNTRPVPVTFNVYTKGSPPVREFRFEVSSDGHMLQIVGAEILASVTLSDTKTEPLHVDLVVDRK